MIDIRPFTLTDKELGEVAELLASVFPKAGFSVAYLRWQYCENPDGLAVGFNAFEGDVIVAHYAAIPLTATVFGVVERGLLSVNTATRATHSGKGLFTTLAQATYQNARENGFSFVIGVANAASTSGFVNKLGFQLVGPLQAMVGWGKVNTKDNVLCDFECNRSEAKIDWRLANPSRRYRLESSGSQMDVVASTDFSLVDSVLTSFDASSLNEKGEKLSRHFRLHLGFDPSKDWTKSRYYNVPIRFRPSPLNFIFLDLTEQKRVLNASTIRFEALDFDAY
jgi:predicted N-acetyltransferase YhbS